MIKNFLAGFALGVIFCTLIGQIRLQKPLDDKLYSEHPFEANLPPLWPKDTIVDTVLLKKTDTVRLVAVGFFNNHLITKSYVRDTNGWRIDLKQTFLPHKKWILTDRGVKHPLIEFSPYTGFGYSTSGLTGVIGIEAGRLDWFLRGEITVNKNPQVSLIIIRRF